MPLPEARTIGRPVYRDRCTRLTTRLPPRRIFSMDEDRRFSEVLDRGGSSHVHLMTGGRLWREEESLGRMDELSDRWSVVSRHWLEIYPWSDRRRN